MKETEKQKLDEITSEMLELADADAALDTIEEALRAACAALKHFTLAPEEHSRISAAATEFAEALAQNVPKLKKKRIGKQALRSLLRKVAADSSGALECLRS